MSELESPIKEKGRPPIWVVVLALCALLITSHVVLDYTVTNSLGGCIRVDSNAQLCLLSTDTVDTY